MVELPMHLKRFQPLKGALDILRYLDAVGDNHPDADDLIDELELSDRAFNKAIRRLVTTNNVQMSASGLYSLTRNGKRATAELAEYDAAVGNGLNISENKKVERRLVVVLPRTLVAKESSPLYVGFDPDSGNQLSSPANLVLRINGVHADIENEGDEMMQLSNDSVSKSLSITPSTYDQARVRVEVLQLSPNGDDVSSCGGLYVDVDVSVGEVGEMTAFSAIVELDRA